MATGRIGTTPVLQVRWSKAPSAGTTSLSGLDDNSVSLVYSVGYEAVYRNGVLLSRTNDYTATDGTTVTLIDATIAGDIIEIFANQTIPLADTYSQTVANGKFINNTLTTTTGDIIYASAANTPARLGIGSTDQVLKVSGGIPAWGAAGSTFAGVWAGNATGIQTLSNNTETVLTFDSERFDTDNYHSTTTNTSRLTVPSGKAGYYLITANAAWNLSASGERYLGIRRNGTSIHYGPSVPGSSSVYVSSQLTAIWNLSVGDYIEFFGYQNSGGNLAVNNNLNGNTAIFAMYLIGA